MKIVKVEQWSFGGVITSLFNFQGHEPEAGDNIVRDAGPMQRLQTCRPSRSTLVYSLNLSAEDGQVELTCVESGLCCGGLPYRNGHSSQHYITGLNVK